MKRISQSVRFTSGIPNIPEIVTAFECVSYCGLSSRTQTLLQVLALLWDCRKLVYTELNHPLNGFNIELLDFNGIGPASYAAANACLTVTSSTNGRVYT